MSKTIVGATDVAVHRVLAPWGEGASDAIGQEGSGTSSEDGDATWIHTFFSDQSWQNPGGDFADSSSAVATIDDFGRYSWTTTPALIEDVTSWIESPDGNSGWILVGDETTSPTAKRFDSRTNSNEENRPSLRVVYSVATAAEGQLPGSSAEIVSAWPNPFSERSTIRLSLRQAGEIEVDVFDVTGRRVSTLANGWRPQGTHAFHFESGALPAGLYVVRALHRPDAGTDSGGKVLTTKVVLTR
jgi:hypothetical protein